MTGFRGRLYRDEAVVLRVQKLGESDRIVTLQRASLYLGERDWPTDQASPPPRPPCYAI